MQWPVVAFDEIDSTNLEAQRRLADGRLEATWITAARQTAGRGRSGRSWQTLDGNLFASLLLPLSCAPGVLHHLSLVSGLALFNAISDGCQTAELELDLRLKWPNDVLIDEAKVAGILVESSIVGEQVVAIMGFGVNLQSAPDIQGRKTTSLAKQGLELSPKAFLERLDHALYSAIGLWDAGSRFQSIRNEWLSRSFPAGHPMVINATGGRVHGVFEGLDEDGALLIRTSTGKIEQFHFGDVAVGGEAAASANGETKNT